MAGTFAVLLFLRQPEEKIEIKSKVSRHLCSCEISLLQAKNLATQLSQALFIAGGGKGAKGTI